MSQHSDEHMAGASNSFWEIGNYKWTTKRIEDGHRLCDDLMKLILDRAEIEKAYAKNLKEWSKKWNSTISKGPEYGTTEAAWLGVLMEAEQRYDLHLRVKENLINEVHSSVKVWQKDHYHKSMMGQLKEKKDIEDMFKKAQKQWAKYYDKTLKAKQDYHNACKNERSAQNQERNAGGDSSLSNDQETKSTSIIAMHQSMKMKKLQERVSKAKEEVQKTKEKYEQALSEISAYNPKYIEEMTHVFDRAQESEQQRLEFFKNILFSTHKCLNVSEDPSLARIYEELSHTISNAEYEKDLKLWSNKYGVNMAMNWPAFEEYSEEFRSISAKGKRGQLPEGAITLLNQRPVDEDLPDYNPDVHRVTKRGGGGKAPLVGGGGSVGGVGEDPPSKGGPPPPTSDKHASPTSSKTSENNRNSAISNGVSVDDDDWDCSERLVDPNKPGVPVKALYDYEGVEDDELSFKIGETFEKLEDQDEQGWCTGRKDGRIGLYPANYVEVI